MRVNRNMNAPRFEQGDYRHEILETQPLGLPFLRVTAEDADTKVSQCPARPHRSKVSQYPAHQLY